MSKNNHLSYLDEIHDWYSLIIYLFCAILKLIVVTNHMMKRFYTYLINFGVESSHTNNYNKRVKLLNFICVLWYHGFILSCFLTIIRNPPYSEVLSINFIGFLLILVSHFINKKGYFPLATYMVLSYVIFHFTILSCYLLPERFIEFFHILVPCVSLLFIKKVWHSWLFFAISIIAFHLPVFIFGHYNSSTILFLSPLMVFLFLSNFIIVLYFKKLNRNNEILLEQERDKVLKDKIILEKQEQKLRELNEFKSHFFVNLSHEIRTPLTIIQGYTAQIETQDLNQENKNKLSIILQQTNQMQSIIDSILDLSKMDTKQFEIVTKPTNLTHFLTKIYTSFKPLFDKKNITFIFETTKKNLYIDIDEDLFLKAINNLLSNALKFTPNSGSVKLKTEQNSEVLTISIEDNGIGIPEDQINNVFKRFYQVKNDITQSQGSGIGLAFTKKILELHGFYIKLYSSPNKETIFSICIPEIAISNSKVKKKDTVIEDPFSQQKEISEDTISIHKDTVNKKQVLVVDDHEQMRAYIIDVLKDYDVTEAEHGKHALQLIKKQSFDMIITDYMMPVMNGETLVKELQKKHIKTPVIVLTARTDNQGKLNMLRLGIDRYLNKPFMEEELLLSIKTSLLMQESADDFNAQLKKGKHEILDNYAEKFNTELNTYIFNNIKSPKFGVDSLAEHFNVSKSTLSRKVRSILGQTPKDIIMEARLQKARLLFEENPYETRKNITEAVGIFNSSYFFNKMEERFGKKRFSVEK